MQTKPGGTRYTLKKIQNNFQFPDNFPFESQIWRDHLLIMLHSPSSSSLTPSSVSFGCPATPLHSPPAAVHHPCPPPPVPPSSCPSSLARSPSDLDIFNFSPFSILFRLFRFYGITVLSFLQSKSCKRVLTLLFTTRLCCGYYQNGSFSW